MSPKSCSWTWGFLPSSTTDRDVRGSRGPWGCQGATLNTRMGFHSLEFHATSTRFTHLSLIHI
eukprot:925125-Alexandrium_andersonii.AAC.1